MLVCGGSGGVAGEVEGAAEALPAPAFDPVMLLGLGQARAAAGAGGGGHRLSFLSLHAHSLALVLPLAAALLHPCGYAACLPLVAVLPGVRGDARVGVKDGQVGGLAAVVLSAAVASFPRLWRGPAGWRRSSRRRGRGRRGGRRRDGHCWLLDEQELGGGFGVVQALPATAPRQGAVQELFRLRLWNQEVVSRVLCEQQWDPVKNEQKRKKIGRRLKSQREQKTLTMNY